MEVEVVCCQLCSFLSPSLRAHISHLRQVHAKDSNFSLVCGIQQCDQRFSTFGSYNSHVYRVHRNSLGLDVPSGVCLSDAQDDCDDEQSTAEPVVHQTYVQHIVP